MDFRGRKNKDRMTGRLLQGFEQGIEGRVGEHMDFVDDIDPIGAMKRRKFHVLSQFSHIVHPGVRRSVNFDDIDGITTSNFHATGASATGLTGWAHFRSSGIWPDIRATVVFPTPRMPEKT